MKSILMVLLLITAVALIAAVLLQPGQSAGIGAISGGAEQLFGKQKARGLELVLHRVTIGLAVLFFVLTLAVMKF